MRLERLLTTAFVGGWCALVPACGGATHPDSPTNAEASIPEICRPIEIFGQPMTVDWQPESRAELETVMRSSVAVVHYDCHTLKVLKDCKVDGSYGFVGVEHKEQVIQLLNQEELQANVPLNGVSLTKQLHDELEHGGALDVATITIGKRSTPRVHASRRDLKGRCEGATHFIRRVSVGAFAIQTGVQSKPATTAQLFAPVAAGAHARSVRAVEGDVKACTATSIDAPTAPSACNAVIDVELTAIDTPTAPAAELQAPKCPKGLVRAQNKCTIENGYVDHDCAFEDAPTCAQECKKGNAASCGRLGWSYAHGYSVAKDEPRALELLTQSCERGSEDACSALGAIYAKGNTSVPADAARAAQFFERACRAGISRGCHNLGVFYRDGTGVAKDPQRALRFFVRACEGGLAVGCAGSADVLEPTDRTKAISFYARACGGGYAEACKDLERLSK